MPARLALNQQGTDVTIAPAYTRFTQHGAIARRDTTFRPTNMASYASAPDTVPFSTKPSRPADTFGVRASMRTREERLDWISAETYRMRTRPELYDERDLDTAEQRRMDLVDGLWRHGVHAYDWDCHACRRAVITADPSDRCPRCCA